MGATDAVEASSGQQPVLAVLTLPAIKQIDAKLAEAVQIGYAAVELVVEKGRLRWIRGPAPSEPVRMQ